MFNKVHVANVKNCAVSEQELDSVTLFTGPNESGKTGMMESLRMAITGRGDIGAKNSSQALIVNGDNAYAIVSGVSEGKSLLGHWSLASKVSKDGTVKNSVSHELKLNDVTQDIDYITAGLPVTSKEFWELTGEQKWTAMESVVGRFDLIQPEDPLPIKREIDSLLSVHGPAPYAGESVDVLRERARGLREWIDNQTEIREHSMYREQKLANDKQKLLDRTQDLADENAKCQKIEEDLAEVTRVKDEVFPLIDEWLRSPEHKLHESGDNLESVMRSLTKEMQENCELLYSVISDHPRLSNQVNDVLVAIGLLVQGIDDESDELSAVSMTHEHVAKICEQLKSSSSNGVRSLAVSFQSNPMPNALRGSLQLLLETAQKNYAASLRVIQAHQSEIEQLKEQTSSEDIRRGGYASEESISQKLAELASVSNMLSQAEEWKRWVDSSSARQAKLAELRSRLETVEESMAAWQEQRSAYLTKSLASVAGIANSILVDCGCKPITLSAETTGKRNTLTLTAGGTDIQAMADSQQTIYGAALLHALQHLSRSACPVMFIKAGEISGDRLGRFLDSLLVHRERGNIFVEHWFKPSTKVLTVEM